MCSTQCRSGQQANEHEHYPINAIIKLYILSSEQEGGPPSNEGHYTFRGNQRKGKISVRESLFGDKNQWRAPPAALSQRRRIHLQRFVANKMLVGRITTALVLLSKSYLWVLCCLHWRWDRSQKSCLYCSVNCEPLWNCLKRQYRHRKELQL